MEGRLWEIDIIIEYMVAPHVAVLIPLFDGRAMGSKRVHIIHAD